MDSIGIAMEVDYTILKQLSTGNNRAVIEKGDEGSYYLMAFWYFRDSNSVPIAIVSVPYFDTEEINPQELRDFLYGLGRVYIALFIITGLLAYFLANYITKSLHAIADSLRRVDIRRKNDPIVWKASDEIGALVHEYNRMLSELENSLEKLAKSERESAWREMARQVAHEIKNPLTPMKLRIQHLQRAWKTAAGVRREIAENQRCDYRTNRGLKPYSR
jgi:two-component system, NtrC family, nitrogen regulation sensor histidine kinase NtrY